MKTLRFLKSLQMESGAFRGWVDGPEYPEITGYLIPTLLDLGENEMAGKAAGYLIRTQNEDGSWNGIDGIPAAFDTAACIEGLRAFDEGIGLYEGNIKKAEEWILKQYPDLNQIYHLEHNPEKRSFLIRISNFFAKLDFFFSAREES